MIQIQKSLLFFVTCGLVGTVLAEESLEFSSHEWWEYGHFYQIYPRSFQDSDGDGIGDLNGITSRLQHLKNINVTGVWLSPIFESPMLDMGYDISDFTKIHREFGTMADFERLVARCKELGIKLILDFVPNHTSDQHEWFKKSADPLHPEHYKYKDYYIWNKGKLENGRRVPPSNWISIFNGPMWTWVASRKAFYLHQFMYQQPDLNFRNTEVSNQMKEVLRFWLRKGVSGFRIDAVPHLFETAENLDELFDDEPLSGECDDPDSERYLTHTNTQHLNETYDLIYQWRDVIDEEEFRSESRILMTEAYGSVDQMSGYYGESKNGIVVRYGAHVPFNFALMGLSQYSKANEFKKYMQLWIDAMPNGVGIHANWVLGNHDQPRISKRFGLNRIDVINILLKTMPGITVTYYGEEIGMTGVDEIGSIDFRIPARTPMQWDNTTNAGFSLNPKPWLPVAEDYIDNNIEVQESKEISHLKVFQQLISLRQNPTFKYGSLTFAKSSDDNVLAYKRELEAPNADMFVVVLNLSENPIGYFNLTEVFESIPKTLQVVICSVDSTLTHGEQIDANDVGIRIGASDGIVLVGRKFMQ